MVVERCLVLAERLRRYGPARDIEVGSSQALSAPAVKPRNIPLGFWI